MPSPANRPSNRSVWFARHNNWTVKFVLLLSLVSAVLALVYVKGETAEGPAAKPVVSVQVTSEGKQFLNLQQPKKNKTDYRGEPALVEALRMGATRMRAGPTAPGFVCRSTTTRARPSYASRGRRAARSAAGSASLPTCRAPRMSASASSAIKLSVDLANIAAMRAVAAASRLVRVVRANSARRACPAASRAA